MPKSTIELDDQTIDDPVPNRRATFDAFADLPPPVGKPCAFRMLRTPERSIGVVTPSRVSASRSAKSFLCRMRPRDIARSSRAGETRRRCIAELTRSITSIGANPLLTSGGRFRRHRWRKALAGSSTAAEYGRETSGQELGSSLTAGRQPLPAGLLRPTVQCQYAPRLQRRSPREASTAATPQSGPHHQLSIGGSPVVTA